MSGAPPGLRDRDVRLAAASALALVLAAWWWSRGYNLADTVEYLLIAERLAAGEALPDGPRSMRPPAFPLFLSPLFLAARALGAEDLRAVVPIARGLQALLSVALVVVAFRLGDALGGRSAGRAAGFFAAASPALLRHGADPLPDVAAAVLVGLGVERFLLRERSARSGAFLLGAACLLSYKALPLVAVLVLLGLAREGRARRLDALAGLGVALALGGALDRLCLGGWWLSLRNYVVYNVTAVVFGVLARLGLRDAAAEVFEVTGRYYGKELDVSGDAVARRIAGESTPAWYPTHLDGFLVLPALMLAALGVWVVLRGRRTPWGIVLTGLVLYIVVLSFKHGKSVRLLLPILPLAAAFAGLGWVALRSATGRSRRLARALAALLLLATPVLAWAAFLDAGPRRYGHYWRAVSWMERSAPAADRPERIAAADPFAVAYRGSPRFAVAPLTIPMAHAAATRGHAVALRRALSGVDWMLLPERYLDERLPLRAVANEEFRLEAAFFEPGNEPALGALAVLRRAEASGSPRRFVATLPPVADAAAGITFEHVVSGRTERVTLLGYSYEDLPGAGVGWMTWYWTTPTGLTTELLVRFVVDDGERRIERRVRPGQGILEPARWPPGRVVAEARLDRLLRAAAGTPRVLATLLVPGANGGAPEQFRIVDGPTAELGADPVAVVPRMEEPR